MSGRRSVAQARDTRSAIVDHAVAVASLEGLEGLTIGRLARDLQMSKAGVFGHFAGKEDLQLVVLEEAIARFREAVWRPAEHVRPGRERLLAICAAWCAYQAQPIFPGGCFLTAAAFEFDGRSGPVRDRIADAISTWRRTLAREARTAIEAGELAPRADPDQIAFELNAAAIGANQARQLHRDARAGERCLRAMRRVLEPEPAPAAAG